MSMYDDVIITTGIRSVAASVLIRRQTSAPSIFGRSLSSRITSGGSCLTRVSALAPSRAVCTTWPRTDSTRTRAMGSGTVDHRAQAGLRHRQGPVPLVDEVRADVALAVDQRALRDRLDPPFRGDLGDQGGPG